MKRTTNQSGYIMLLIIITGAVFLIVVAAVTALSAANLKSSRLSLEGLSALSVAEAGADNAIFNLNKDRTYTGTNTSCPISSTGSNPVTFFNNTSAGKATYETCITDGTIANEKIVYSTAKLYLPTNFTTPVAVRKLKIILIGTYTGTYGVQTGPGGLILNNSAAVVNGDVYVGGEITLNNSSTIGSINKPLNVWAGGYDCPKPQPDGSYPKLCSTGDSIHINGTQSHIYGTVNSNNQTTSTGMSNPGLAATSGVADSVLPDYDRSAQKNAVTSTLTAANASCSNNQTRSWPANVHITGNVTIANNCVVTVQGNVWIDGSLSLTQKGIIQVDNSVGVRPVIMIDGAGGLSLTQQTSISSNSSGLGIEFITFWASSGCSPDCSSLSGTALATSQATTTINLANQGLSTGSIVYARWSKVVVGQSGSLGQVLGQTIEFDNTGNITFGSIATGTPTYSYTVRYYEPI